MITKEQLDAAKLLVEAREAYIAANKNFRELCISRSVK